MSSTCLNIESTLGFQSNVNVKKTEEPPHLLLHVLSFISTSTDLANTRQVCQEFRNCSDAVATVKVKELLGNKDIKPMFGQSGTALLHGAEEADEATREYLKDWHVQTARSEGFEVGLPTIRTDQCHVLAGIKIKSPDALVPVMLSFNQDLKLGLATHEVGTQVHLPPRFLHLNIWPDSGRFDICNQSQNDDHETSILDSLRRVKYDIYHPNADYPRSYAPYRLYRLDQSSRITTGEPSKLYRECIDKCIGLFSGYQLGQPTPDLTIFYKRIEAKVSEYSMRYA